ncbi:MAG: hypothetical protein HY908_18405, partial [Myxococcales bacterium]|nr:hypothetical protein [Myxococcales bacterium]
PPVEPSASASASPGPEPVAPASASASVPRLPSRAESVVVLEALIRKLAPLHRPLGRPAPGDWLAEHPESGQTFAEYRVGLPALPDLAEGPGRRRTLCIQPLGPLTDAERSVVVRTGEFMRRFFGLPVRFEPDLGLELVPPEARRTHPSWGDKQLLAPWVLDHLLGPRLPADAMALISFTASDLWPGMGWNFVFGQASLGDRIGVWSIHRNGDPAAGAEGFRQVLLRTMRIAVHETGHMFSLEHCTRYRCVMNGVNSLDEADRTPAWLCPECLAKIAWATLVEPAARFRALAAFADAEGLGELGGYYRQALAALDAP